MHFTVSSAGPGTDIIGQYDGSLEATQPIGGSGSSTVNSGTLQFGRCYLSSGAYGTFVIDEFRTWDRKLSDTEIVDVYEA